jgi:hypothetical protein
MATDNQVMRTALLRHDQAMSDLHADDFGPVAAQLKTDHA